MGIIFLGTKEVFGLEADPLDPIQAAIDEIEQRKKDLEDVIQKLQQSVQSMLKDPSKLNIGYLMTLFNAIPDANVAYQASKTVGISNAIKADWQNISSQFNRFVDVQKYQPGQTIFYPEDVNNGKGVRLDGVAADGNLMVTFLDDSGSPTGGSVEYNPSAPDGSLKPGVPFFDLAGQLGVTFNKDADPILGKDAFKPSGAPGPVAFAEKMIQASYIMSRQTLQTLDDLNSNLRSKYAAELKKDGVDVGTICSVLKDMTAAFASSNNPTYTILASTGEYENVSQSTVDNCLNYLSNFNSSKNTVETTMNSTASQSQVALNQAMGSYQSEMTASGGSLSSYLEGLRTIVSNEK